MERPDLFAAMRLHQLQRVTMRLEHMRIVVEVDAESDGERYSVVSIPNICDPTLTHTLKIDDRFLFGMYIVRRSIMDDLKTYQ